MKTWSGVLGAGAVLPACAAAAAEGAVAHQAGRAPNGSHSQHWGPGGQWPGGPGALQRPQSAHGHQHRYCILEGPDILCNCNLEDAAHSLSLGTRTLQVRLSGLYLHEQLVIVVAKAIFLLLGFIGQAEPNC